jgi:undecaprenyl diphosphate synthase
MVEAYQLREERTTMEPATRLAPQPRPVPRHVAIIMDGNGRWANQRGRPRVFGHRRGARAVRTIVTAARKRGIEYLTLYALSTENLLRPPDEVKALFGLFRRFMLQERDEMLQQDIRFRVMGDRSHLPPEVDAVAREVEETTASCRTMNLTVAVAYGGREDLVAGLVELTRQGIPITAGSLEQCLWSAHLPQVDLMIRTGGERRISNFLLWHLAYAELMFTDVRWPDFNEAHFDRALTEFTSRHRRFGQVTLP